MSTIFEVVFCVLRYIGEKRKIESDFVNLLFLVGREQTIDKYAECSKMTKYYGKVTRIERGELLGLGGNLK